MSGLLSQSQFNEPSCDFYSFFCLFAAVRLDTMIWKRTARQWGKLDDERYRLETEGRKMWLKLEIERRRRQVETDSVLEGPDGFGLSDSDIPYACTQVSLLE